MPGSDTALDLDRLAGQLAETMREAGGLIASIPRPLKIWNKAGDSPVTEADIAVDRLLRERLTAAVPGVGWLSEESEDDLARLDAPRLWIVDPIDGTRAFIGERNDWSISVALVENGRPVLAAVFAPAEDALFAATIGRGTTCNGIPLATTASDSLDGARVTGPRRHMDKLVTLAPRVVVEPRIHSLALRLARVAQGAIDAAFVSGSSRDWDLAAADLLVHEAGGVLTTLSGRTLAYNRHETTHGALVAAGRSRHQALTDLLRGAVAELG